MTDPNEPVGSLFLAQLRVLLVAALGFSWLLSCRPDSSSVVSLRAVPPRGGDSDALDADRIRRGMEEVSKDWQPGFYSESELSDPSLKLVAQQIETQKWSAARSFDALSPCFRSHIESMIPAVATVEAKLSRASLVLDTRETSGNNDTGAFACPGDGPGTELARRIRLVFAVGCLDGSSLVRFAGERARSFLNTRVSDFCYGAPTAVLLELQVQDGESSHGVVLNNGAKGLCTVDFSDPAPRVPDKCTSLISEQSDQNESPPETGPGDQGGGDSDQTTGGDPPSDSR